MKNRKLLYLLVPLALFLWSMIIYRIFNQVNQKDETLRFSENINYNPEKPLTDTFELIANYSDPFLERSFITSADYSNSSNVRIDDIPKEFSSNVSWPEIRYRGMILNKNANKYLFMVEIDKINHLVKSGDQVGSIKIVKVSKDSITVKFKNYTKTVLKENI